jgi:hypothetical protein
MDPVFLATNLTAFWWHPIIVPERQACACIPAHLFKVNAFASAEQLHSRKKGLGMCEQVRPTSTLRHSLQVGGNRPNSITLLICMSA